MTVILISSWVLFSLLIAILGHRYRFGFWGYLFGSLLLTPLLGMLLLIAAVPPKKPDCK